MAELVLATFDRVSEDPPGFVRDMRLRWVCKEAEQTCSATESCLTQITTRSAFEKAHVDQMAHFAAVAQ